MVRFKLLYFRSAETLGRAAATAWLERVQRDSIHESPHCVALSGGRIARNFLTSAASLAAGQPKLLGNVHFFWADERCVPPHHSESNYRLAQECLFSEVPVWPGRIHRIRGEISPKTAALRARREMLENVSVNDIGLPELSLVILGMGEDGHVASLFPGQLDPEEGLDIYRPVSAPKAPIFRITLNYNVIQSAREVFVLVSGPGKEKALRHSLDGIGSTPLARVLGTRYNTSVWTDVFETREFPKRVV